MSIGHDPIAVLMEEHRIFLRRLQEFRRVLGPFPEKDPPPSTARASAAGFARFLAREVDGLHGRKEEEGLFPAIARHVGSEGGPVGVMLQDHVALREHQSTLSRDTDRIESDPGATEAWSRILAATEAVDDLLRFHIDKEDRVLFPMARELLSPAEMAEVAQICREIEERFGPAHRPSDPGQPP